MIGAHIDITECKAAEHRIGKLLEEAGQRERALRDKQDQLIQAAKLVSLGEMATGVAHEINNPLNNISLFAGNILDGLEHGADVTAEGLTGQSEANPPTSEAGGRYRQSFAYVCTGVITGS